MLYRMIRSSQPIQDRIPAAGRARERAAAGCVPFTVMRPVPACAPPAGPLVRRTPLLLLLLAAALLSACQPTPEVEPVAQKDSEALIERVEVAEEGVADMAKAPETRHITRALTEVSQKTGIDITIDADVVLPETDAIPVARVKNGPLDVSVLENIWKTLGNSSGMLTDLPRSYFEEQARMWIEFREEGVLGKYNSFEEMEAAISELLAEAATKPAEPVFSPESPMETIIESVLEDGTPVKYIPSFYGWSDQETVYEMQLSTLGPISFLRNIDDSYSFEEYTAGDSPLDRYLPAIERGEFRVQLPERSIEDAQAYAEQLLAELGIADFTCVVARIAPLIPRFFDEQQDVCPCAYELVFTRQVAGVNVTYNDVKSSGGETKNRSADSPDYTPSWGYEYIKIFVDDAGVFALEFRQPYEVTEIVTERAEILSLEEAVASFERMIGYQYAAYETGEEELCDDAYLCIDEIRLGLTRIAEKNAQQQGYLVPSWTFFGSYDLDGFWPDGEGHHGTEAILIVNALDGSIIDPDRGF